MFFLFLHSLSLWQYVTKKSAFSICKKGNTGNIINLLQIAWKRECLQRLVNGHIIGIYSYLCVDSVISLCLQRIAERGEKKWKKDVFLGRLWIPDRKRR